MSEYERVCRELRNKPKHWLVTGCAGFIGSNILETLLALGQRVTGLDNFATGYPHNLDQVKALTGPENWGRFKFIQGDICTLETCVDAVTGVDYVLHQAALGSVPRSLADPLATNAANVAGFLNILLAARDSGVQSFTYAASSSTYGDHPDLPKVEEHIGKPLSPYAVTKYVNELYAEVFARCYGFGAIGLRYFNVFGRRQDPQGAYAAVIPCWTAAMIADEPVYINGDGETSRDFCFVANAVQANILAATTAEKNKNEVFNVAFNARTSLNELFALIRGQLKANQVVCHREPIYREFRAGDVRHSQADISKAAKILGYRPQFSVAQGLQLAMPWYVKALGAKHS